VGKGCVIGANAVLLESTGENEVWVGVPAKHIGDRA
jgi:serine O-acetyltransferase